MRKRRKTIEKRIDFPPWKIDETNASNHELTTPCGCMAKIKLLPLLVSVIHSSLEISQISS